MKKVFLSILLPFFVLIAKADEGMWLPYLLGEQVYADMVKKGLKLTKEQLYSINKTSLKDAIIIFGGGCTGEIVSNQGLIFTNHHCGYDAIASASSVDHNYLRDGFWAANQTQEIPSQSLSVQFLLKIVDVTKDVEDSLQGLSGEARIQKMNTVFTQINKKNTDPTQNIEARTYSMFKGNQFIMYVYQRYKDIRFVGTPPENVGKFGGDTDNWEWPRHTGDFSVFRVYTSPDGKPAEYSPNNIPLKPKYALPVSIKGLNDGDYAMIYGYPGGTNRYETSYGVKLSTDINNPSLVALREMRLKYMLEEMKKDPAVKLQLASSYAGIANYWKFFDGETKQLLNADVYAQKQKQETDFQQWAAKQSAADQTLYSGLFEQYAKNYQAWRPYAKARMYLREGILGSPLASFAVSLSALEKGLVTPGKNETDYQKISKGLQTAYHEFIADENKASDIKILADACMLFYRDIDKNQHPIGFYESIRQQFGDLNDDNTFKKWAGYVFSNTMFLDSAKWNAFMQKPDAVVLQNDPAYNYATAFYKNYMNKYLPMYTQFMNTNDELGRRYIKGVLVINKGKAMYPDANSSMRVSYGNVKSYNPRDAVHYDYVCTMKGIMEKYKPNDYEFDLSSKFIDLAKKHDFGPYVDKQRNDLVVSFITTNDITGGNSGSPVMNGNGELIGLAFDGNYEALSHKMIFDKDLNRTICVDVRYVLWCIDKLGGAKHIVDELKIVR